MRTTIINLLYCLLFLSAISSAFAQSNQRNNSKSKTLIIFFDGLRPDYINKEQMPNLYAFRRDACFGAQHHSVFPTVTRVNSASYATGSYPGTHGLLGNAIYIPEVNKLKAIGTGYGDLSKIPEATSGQIVTATSLGEALKSVGEKMMVFSSGTTGQAFLQNHTVNGAIVNPDLILPETFKSQVLADIGAAPEESELNDNARHKWITDGLLKYGIATDGPLVSAIWFSDPDGAAHSHGIGSKEAVAAIQYVDGQFGRILEALTNRSLETQFNIIISTDHGFVTHIGKQSVTDLLINVGLKKDKDSDDIILAEGAIYVKNHDENSIQKIVSALHKEEWIGAVFTKPIKSGDPNGWVKGTLSYDVIHYNHPRAGDILTAPNWNDQKNDQGFSGTGFSGGVAGHGGSSPYEINITLFAKGPDFKKSFTSSLPTSNVDIVPTILGMYGIPIPKSMDGRVVSEFFDRKTASKSESPKKEMLETEVKYPWGTYKLVLERSLLGEYKYVNYTKTSRTFK